MEMELPRKRARRVERLFWLDTLKTILQNKRIPIEKVYEWVNEAGREKFSIKTLQRHRERLLKKD